MHDLLIAGVGAVAGFGAGVLVCLNNITGAKAAVATAKADLAALVAKAAAVGIKL